uniref:Uncharacterized protein n=1 Tax=Lygus hesperus TaxID=30085 RepID=A0A0A9YK42_LYGHE
MRDSSCFFVALCVLLVAASVADSAAVPESPPQNSAAVSSRLADFFRLAASSVHRSRRSVGFSAITNLSLKAYRAYSDHRKAQRSGTPAKILAAARLLPKLVKLIR